MPSLEVLLAFTVTAVVMNLSPGPSNLYVMARAISQGATGGLVAAAGLAVGSLVHVVAAVFGLAAVFQYSPLAYTVFKLAGAGYLIYLGVSYWRARPAAIDEAERLPVKSLGTVFRESVIVEATNPKTALFFLALLPQFVDPAAGPVAPQFLLLGLGRNRIGGAVRCAGGIRCRPGVRMADTPRAGPELLSKEEEIT